MERETESKGPGLDFKCRPKVASLCNNHLQSSAQRADPVRESATRWHFKANHGPVVNYGGTGRFSALLLQGDKMLLGWTAKFPTQAVWTEFTGIAEKKKGGSSNKNLCNSLALEKPLIQIVDLSCISKNGWATARKPVPSLGSWNWVWGWNIQFEFFLNFRT